MTRILVLGVGSPFGADTLGWRVVERLETVLKHHAALRATVDLKCEDRPGLSLIEILRPYDHVLLVDAVVSGEPPGTLHHLDGDTLRRFDAALSSHAAGVFEALAIGAAIGALPRRLEMYGVEIEPDGQPSDSGIDDAVAAIVEHLGVEAEPRR